MKFDFELLKKGTSLKRKSWGGYWKWENNTIMMYCKDGKIVDFRNNEDMNFTLSNMFEEDWEVATNENCTIPVM